MACRYLKTYTVPIPQDQGPVVIRKQKTVEYELDRTYSSKTGDSRVRRRVIGKVDPCHPGRMYPNENYFELFPKNEVPDEVRDCFLRECAIKRDMAVVKKDPIEVIKRVQRGLALLHQEGELIRMENEKAAAEKTQEIANAHEAGAESKPSSEWVIQNPYDAEIVHHMFLKIYYFIETLAEKHPNEVMSAYGVRMINKVLDEIRACYYQENTSAFLRLIDEPKEVTDEKGKKTLTGRTYADILIILQMYESMPYP